MKKIKQIILLLAVITAIFSCNKDRVEDPENSYSNADSFYEDNKEEEQEFIITSDTGDCIVAKKGTIICGTRSLLRTPSNDTVGLPYSVKVVELYSLKDHILYRFPTTANGTALKNDGTVRIKAIKDNEELKINTTGAFNATYSVNPATSGNSAFKGTMSDDNFSDWETANDGSTLAASGNKDKLTMGSFGWFQAAQNTYGSSTTTVSFDLDGTGGESLDIWLTQADNNTTLHGNNLKVENVPTGQTYTAIIIAVDQDNKLVLHESTFIATAGKTISIDFKEVEEDALLSKLETL